jgi:uncharacterized surface protein with fasciclin (FAS1) repeats
VGFSLVPFGNCSTTGADDGSLLCFESADEGKLQLLKTIDPAVCDNTLLRPGNCSVYAFSEFKGTVGIDSGVKKYTQSPGPHLWFSIVNYLPSGGGGARCGEVDAAPRIPAALFDPSNRRELERYIKITNRKVGTKLGRCQDQFGNPNCRKECTGAHNKQCKDCENGPDTSFSVYSGYLDSSWAVPDVMSICQKLCNCTYDYSNPSRGCQDKPDDPQSERFCSLCGPKYNAEIAVTVYHQPDPGPPPEPECNPDKGCTVCAACCESFIPDGKSCDACVQTKCSRSGKTIVDIAGATSDLSTLVAALKAGGLIPTLLGTGPFTVFAPTNEAFDALPTGTVPNLLKPENKARLVDILTYHVVAGNVQAKDLKDGQMLKTVEGKSLTVRIVGAEVFISSAKVTNADVEASNGVVHIIDEVLLPPTSFAS